MTRKNTSLQKMISIANWKGQVIYLTKNLRIIIFAALKTCVILRKSQVRKVCPGLLRILLILSSTNDFSYPLMCILCTQFNSFQRLNLTSCLSYVKLERIWGIEKYYTFCTIKVFSDCQISYLLRFTINCFGGFKLLIVAAWWRTCCNIC